MSALDFAARGMSAHNRAALNRLIGFRRSRIVATGDSITAGSHGRSAGGNELWGDSYANLAIARCGGRFHAVANTGIGSNTSTQMLARWRSDVLAHRPDIVLLMIGTNDITSGGSTAQIATLMGNIEQMVLRSFAAGVLVVLVTPPATNNAPAEMRRAIPYFYRLAEAYDLPLIDMFALTVDPQADSGGGWKAGYNADAAHPNTTGQAAMATHAAAILSDLAAYQPKPYLAAFSETNIGQPANLIANGNFTRQTTPGVPNGWTINASGATYDVAANAAAPFTGKEFAYTKTSGGAVFVLQSAGFSATVGDRLRFSGSVEVSGLPGSPGGWTLGLGNDGNAVRPFAVSKHAGNFVFDVPAIAEAVTLTPSLYATDNGTYRLRNLTALNLTAMDAVWKPATAR